MITQQEREMIQALYWEQPIFSHPKNDIHEWATNLTLKAVIGHGWRVDEWFAKVTPLHLITDEHAVEIYELCRKWNSWKYRSNDNKIDKGKQIVRDIQVNGCYWLPHMLIVVIDYLRSNVYALPAFGHTVDELVSEGVFKLREPNKQ